MSNSWKLCMRGHIWECRIGAIDVCHEKVSINYRIFRPKDPQGEFQSFVEFIGKLQRDQILSSKLLEALFDAGENNRGFDIPYKPSNYDNTIISIYPHAHVERRINLHWRVCASCRSLCWSGRAGEGGGAIVKLFCYMKKLLDGFKYIPLLLCRYSLWTSDCWWREEIMDGSGSV